MTIYIKGTDNSASAPALAGTDATTGMYFPASDTIAWAITSAEAMCLDSGGNLGVGVSSPARKVEIQGSSGNIAGLRVRENSANTATDGGAFLELYGTRSDGSVGYYGAILGGRTDNASNNNGYLAFYSGVTDATSLLERARFDHSGNLLVGTTSNAVSARGVFSHSGAGYGVMVGDVGNAANRTGIYFRSTTENRIAFDSTAGAYLSFVQGTTERARIDSSGNLLVGGTSTRSSAKLDVLGGVIALGANSTYYGTIDYSAGTGTLTFTAESGGKLAFKAGATSYASFDSNGYFYYNSPPTGAGTYALKWESGVAKVSIDTSSARYKDNIRDSVYGLADILRLRSAMFEYKDSGRTDVGLIAEEVNEVIPHLAIKDTNGRPDAVAYDRMVSVLIKGMQDQQAIIESLKSRLDAAGL